MALLSWRVTLRERQHPDSHRQRWGGCQLALFCTFPVTALRFITVNLLASCFPPPLTCSQALHTVFSLSFATRSTINNMGVLLRHITVAVIYLCLRARLGLLWASARRSRYSGGGGVRMESRKSEESQTKHESEGVSQSACEHPGGLWESVSIEKCPRGWKLTDASKTSRAFVPGGAMGTWSCDSELLQLQPLQMKLPAAAAGGRGLWSSLTLLHPFKVLFGRLKSLSPSRALKLTLSLSRPHKPGAETFCSVCFLFSRTFRDLWDSDERDCQTVNLSLFWDKSVAIAAAAAAVISSRLNLKDVRLIQRPIHFFDFIWNI